jgi:hypothetical protein
MGVVANMSNGAVSPFVVLRVAAENAYIIPEYGEVSSQSPSDFRANASYGE